MPIYPYVCRHCDHSFEVVKSVKNINDKEHCDKCKHETIRVLAREQSIDKIAAADWNRKEYNPGLGGAFTPKEASKEAKRRGLIEVGNESPEKIHKHFEKQRAEDVRQRYATI